MRHNRDKSADTVFIRNAFNPLAVIAWSGYQEAGRGFIVIPHHNQQIFPGNKNVLEMSSNLLSGGIRAFYLPAEDLLEYPIDNAEEMVDRYDVKREILVMIEREDCKGWNAYRFIGEQRPAAVYKQLKHRLSLLKTSFKINWGKKPLEYPSYAVVPA